jgi:cystathionine gamma-synthase
VPPFLASTSSGPTASPATSHARWEAFEEVIGGLEGGIAVAFASGMGACAGVLTAAGANVLPDDCYHESPSSRRVPTPMARLEAGRHRSRVARPSGRLTSAMGWSRPPDARVADLEATCAAPRRPGACRLVDNTLATPLQQPLALGADLVAALGDKFIGGHLTCSASWSSGPWHTAQLRAARRGRRDAGALEV